MDEKSNAKHFRFEATFTPRVPTPAPAIIITLPIPVYMFYTGISDRLIYYNRTSLCSYCKATGAIQSDHQCPYCNGTGLREYIHLSESKDQGVSYKSRCDICHGSGHVHDPSDSCPYCHGTGIRVVRDYVDVATDPGIRAGTELTFKRMGNEQFGYRHGDVIIRIVAETDSLFQVDGYTLLTTLWISVVESICGFERKVLLPSNETVTVECAKKCSNGTQITLQGKGIPIGSSGLKGPLIVSLLVYVPLLLTTSETNQLKSVVGPSFPQLATYLSYLAQQKVDFPFSLEEAYYSWSCPMDSSSCSFSLLNMIQYTLYSVLFQTNRQNTIHRPLPLRLPSYRASFHSSSLHNDISTLLRLRLLRLLNDFHSIQ
ncbi:hypothetical protein WA171_005952 [Blastocystis sp. BT1]